MKMRSPSTRLLRAVSRLGALLLLTTLGSGCGDVELSPLVGGSYRIVSDPERPLGDLSVELDPGAGRAVFSGGPLASPVERPLVRVAEGDWIERCPMGLKRSKSELARLGEEALTLGELVIERPTLMAGCYGSAEVTLVPGGSEGDAPGILFTQAGATTRP